MNKKIFHLFIQFNILFIVLIVLLISCDDEDTDNVSPSITKSPDIVLDPNGNTPLAALLTLETNEQTRVSVQVDVIGGVEVNKATVSGDDTSFLIDFDNFDKSHSLPILGLSPDSSHSIEVTVFDKSGNATVIENILEVETGPLPDNFPPIEVTSKPNMMEPGVTIFTLTGRGGNGSAIYIIAVDETGRVVWYFEPDAPVSDMRRLSNGNLLFIQGAPTILEVDMLGNTVNQWFTSHTTSTNESAIPVDALAFHHEVFEMENGNFLVLDLELRQVENYPTSETDPEAASENANVVGDVIMEFNRDGEIENSYSMLDMLDPLRIGYLSLASFYDFIFPAAPGGTRDWTHGNAVIHDPSDDSIIVSLRHQDAVVKFSRSTGDLIWILGPHENWDQAEFGPYLLDPTGENFRFQYHQHAPMVTTSGNILLFDNGNFRASPFDEKLPATENFSRAVEYSLNQETMEVEQVWEYGEFINEPIYAPFLCDADQMPATGNVLITFGGITENELGEPVDSGGGAKVSVRILEVTHTDNPEIVFDLSIVDESEIVANGWITYRSERLPGLYP